MPGELVLHRDVARGLCQGAHPGDGHPFRNMKPECVGVTRNRLRLAAPQPSHSVLSRIQDGERPADVPGQLGMVRHGADQQDAGIVRLDFNLHPVLEDTQQLLVPEIERNAGGGCRKPEVIRKGELPPGASAAPVCEALDRNSGSGRLFVVRPRLLAAQLKSDAPAETAFMDSAC